MAACGATLDEIALALGVSMPTLRKHYFFEVERYAAARLRLKAKLLAGLLTEADAGNVTAAKEMFKQIERGVVARQPVERKNVVSGTSVSDSVVCVGLHLLMTSN